VARSGAKVVEVPSYEAKRLSGESNLNTFRDGSRVLRTILSERFGASRAGMLPRPAASYRSASDRGPLLAPEPTPEVS